MKYQNMFISGFKIAMKSLQADDFLIQMPIIVEIKHDSVINIKGLNLVTNISYKTN